MRKSLRIATRKSRLALWQSEYVRQQLKQAWPGLEIELLPMSTRGDEVLNRPLADIGGKGLFLKELERALINCEADLAVHSLKDVPAELTEGLTLAAFLPRADAEDVWITRDGVPPEQLPSGSRVGSSSLRRMSQLCSIRSDLDLIGLRGNVETRLDAVATGKVDATILAAAGLRRLGIEPEHSIRLPIDTWLPAPGQGVITVQCRDQDHEIIDYLSQIHCPITASTITAERAVIRQLGGDCRMPLAAFAWLEGEVVHLHARLGDTDGRLIDAKASECIQNAIELGYNVAERLIRLGGNEILESLD